MDDVKEKNFEKKKSLFVWNYVVTNYTCIVKKCFDVSVRDVFICIVQEKCKDVRRGTSKQQETWASVNPTQGNNCFIFSEQFWVKEAFSWKIEFTDG